MKQISKKPNSFKVIEERRKLLLVLILLAALAFLAYANTLNNEFVFDDIKIIRDNTTIRSLSTVPEIFSNMFVYRPLKGQGTKIDPSYRPIRYLSYAIDYQFTGLNPTGYHISNILYHTIASFLIFILLKRLTGNFGSSLALSLVFVVHPVHTESVAYLTGRKDVLCTIFYLLAFLSFIKYREKPRILHAVLLPVFFALAFMAKEMAITLIGIMFLYDAGLWLKERKAGFSGIIKKGLIQSNLAIYLPVGLLTLFFAGTALFLKNPGGMGNEYVGRWGGSLYVSTLTMLRGITHYIRMLFVPLGLSADYSYNAFPVSNSLFEPVTTLFSLWIIAALLAVGVVLLLKKRFLQGFAMLFFFISLVPIMQIIPLPERLAERFLYLPSFGIMVLGVLLFNWLSRKGKSLRYASVAAVILIVVLFFGMTVKRNAEWKNSLTLHSSVIKLYPDCARSQLAVAEAYASRALTAKDRTVAERDYLSAIKHFTEVLGVLPVEVWQGWRRGYALNALIGRALAHGNVGNFEAAISDLSKVLGENDVYGEKIAENPNYLHVHYNLGENYYAEKKYEEAIEQFEIAACLAKGKDARDYMVKAGYKKALALAAQEKLREALSMLKETAILAKGTLEEISINYHIGLFHLELKEDKEALKSFNKVISLCREYGDSPQVESIEGPLSVVRSSNKTKSRSYYMIAQVHDRIRKPREALKALEEAVKYDPDFLAARYTLGDFYFKFGKLDAAEKEFRRVLNDEPNHTASKTKLLLIKEKRHTIKKRKEPSPQKIILLHEAALRDYHAGDIEPAKDKLKEALQITSKLEHNKNVMLLAAKVGLLLGRIYYDQNSLDLAEAQLRKALELVLSIESKETYALHGEGNYWFGHVLIKKGENEHALTFLKKSIPFLRKAAKDTKSAVEAAGFLIHSARANKASESYEQELADYKKVIAILPDYPSVHYLAGQAAKRAGKPAEAIELYNKSIEKKSKVVQSHYEIGMLLLEHGKQTKAVLNFQSALKITKDPYYLSACNYYLGEAFYSQGLYPLAVRAWKEYLKHEKNPLRRELIEKKLDNDPKLK